MAAMNDQSGKEGERNQISPSEMDQAKSDMDFKQKRRDLFEEQARETWKILQKSSEDFDKAILTYSASALGLSVAFIQNVVPREHAHHLFFLFSAWILFTLAILFTVISFKISSRAQYVHLKHCQKYYLDEMDEYLSRRNWWNVANEVMTVSAGACFALGVLGIAVFGIFNYTETQTMDDKRGLPTGDLQRGQSTMVIIPAPNEGRPASPPQTSTSNSQSTGQGTGDKN